MIPANYSLARNMARKVLKQYKIVDVPIDLRKICEGEGLEFIELDDPKPLTTNSGDINTQFPPTSISQDGLGLMMAIHHSLKTPMINLHTTIKHFTSLTRAPDKDKDEL